MTLLYHHHHHHHHHHPLPLPPPPSCHQQQNSTTTTTTTTSTSTYRFSPDLDLPPRLQHLPRHPDYLPTPTINCTVATRSSPFYSLYSSGSSRDTEYNNTISYDSGITASHSQIYNYHLDQAQFDDQVQQIDFDSSNTPSLMQFEQNNAWLANGQLTPSSATRGQHRYRESSFSSLGSTGPASPYTANTSNPQVAGELYHDYAEFYPSIAKSLTPAATPLQDTFPLPLQSSLFYHAQIPFATGGVIEGKVDAALGPGYSAMTTQPAYTSSAASSDSLLATTPPEPELDEQRHKHAFRNTMPKLDRTMTDIYQDELYNPGFQFTSTASTAKAPVPATAAAANDVIAQRLQAANSQHLSASAQQPVSIPSREESPFRPGSLLAPLANSYATSPSLRLGTASHLREQQKAVDDARALREQMERTSPRQVASQTISPKEVDLVFQESEEDASQPLFPPVSMPLLSTVYSQRLPLPPKRETTDADESASVQSDGSMATSRRESSTYSSPTPRVSSQNTLGYGASPVRGIPQQYPFTPHPRRQQSSFSNVTEAFPASLTSMESSSSDYLPERSESSVLKKKPAGASADTGTYTCTYHGCMLRFETPAKLQKHKREGHRSSATAAVVGGTTATTSSVSPAPSSSGHESTGGMTSAAALRNTQNGPHKCERINPSTGKPCNTIFSRPYDLTRHEDTIHNARKQKVRCHLCTEEKTFSRNDALTRHFRVCHPDHLEAKTRRRSRRE